MARKGTSDFLYVQSVSKCTGITDGMQLSQERNNVLIIVVPFRPEQYLRARAAAVFAGVVGWGRGASEIYIWFVCFGSNNENCKMVLKHDATRMPTLYVGGIPHRKSIV